VDLKVAKATWDAILKEDTEGSFQLSKFNLFTNFQKRLEKMIHFQDETVENLGYNIIDGQETIEFRIQLTEKDQIIGWQGKGTFTIWADTETKLPIRLEWYDEMFGVNTIADNLELNRELDESIFEMNVPDEFELETIQDIAVHRQAPGNPTGLDEEKMIEGFRNWVLLSDGIFPSSMTMDTIKDLDPNASMTFKQVGWGFHLNFNSKRINEKYNSDKHFQTALTKAINGLFMVFGLPADSDWHYAGKGVAMGEADRAIFWYRPQDSTSYRVIYGDLTVEDVAPEDLPE